MDKRALLNAGVENVSISKKTIAGILIAIIAVAVIITYEFCKQPITTEKLTIVMKDEPVSMDPGYYRSLSSASVMAHVFETLLDPKFDAEGRIVGFLPRLALSWRQVNDTTWEFKLRHGVKFHCGHEFVANDVKYSFERLMDLPNSFAIDPLNKFEVVDNYTIRIGSDVPFSPTLAQLTQFYGNVIVCPDCVEKYGEDWGKKYICGTGPYKLVEWVKGERMVFERNDEYWGQKPKIRELVFRAIPDDSARVVALETGEVDVITHVPPSEVERLKGKGFNVVIKPGVKIQYVVMDTRKAPFSDKRVRQAVNYAIDRESIVNSLLSGFGYPADSYLAPQVFGYKKISLEYNPDKAKQLLADAGYPNGFDCEFWTIQGRWLMDRQVSEAVAGYLSQVGINAKLTVLEYGAWARQTYEQIEMVRRGEQPTYDMFWSCFGASTLDADWCYALNFVSIEKDLPGGWNEALISNSTIDDLILAARATANETERLQLYYRVQDLLAEEAPWAPVFLEPLIVAMRPAIKGALVLPNEGYFFYNCTLS
jgi:peptide/nickel transport system substrate-binding protein